MAVVRIGSRVLFKGMGWSPINYYTFNHGREVLETRVKRHWIHTVEIETRPNSTQHQVRLS